MGIWASEESPFSFCLTGIEIIYSKQVLVTIFNSNLKLYNNLRYNEYSKFMRLPEFELHPLEITEEMTAAIQDSVTDMIWLYKQHFCK